jgi:hypothetical protein
MRQVYGDEGWERGAVGDALTTAFKHCKFCNGAAVNKEIIGAYDYIVHALAMSKKLNFISHRYGKFSKQNYSNGSWLHSSP